MTDSNAKVRERLMELITEHFSALPDEDTEEGEDVTNLETWFDGFQRHLVRIDAFSDPWRSDLLPHHN